MKRRDLIKSSMLSLGLLAIPGLASAAALPKSKSFHGEILAEFKKTYDGLLFSTAQDVVRESLALCRNHLWPRCDSDDLVDFSLKCAFTRNRDSVMVRLMATDKANDCFGMTALISASDSETTFPHHDLNYNQDGYVNIRRELKVINNLKFWTEERYNRYSKFCALSINSAPLVMP